MLKLMSKSFCFLIALLCFSFSCNKKNEYYLTSLTDKNTSFKIAQNIDSIIISEKDNTKNISKSKIFFKINNNYVLKLSDEKHNIYFSTDIHKSLIRNDFSLLNDSIITGNKEGVSFFTEIKSNNKPVNYKYYYDSTFKINRIEYRIGGKTFIYN